MSRKSPSRKSRPSGSVRVKIGSELALPPESPFYKKWKSAQQRKAKKILDNALKQASVALQELPPEYSQQLLQNLPPEVLKQMRSQLRKKIADKSLLQGIRDVRLMAYTLLSLSDKQIAQYVWRSGNIMLAVMSEKTKKTRRNSGKAS